MNKFWTTYKKRFWGINGSFDEYKQAILNEIGNRAYMLTFSIGIINNFIAILLGNISYQVAFFYLIITNIIFGAGIAGYSLHQLRKSGALMIETDSSHYNLTISDINRSVLRSSLIFLIGMFFLTFLLELVNPNGGIDSFFQWTTLVRVIGSSIIFGPLIRYFVIRRVKEYEDE
ncbi:DUF3278 domain-containing protein [Hutsoniella sourekii]